MSMEKHGDISSSTPQPDCQDEKQGSDKKASPNNKKQADLLEDSPVTRVSDAAAEAASEVS